MADKPNEPKQGRRWQRRLGYALAALALAALLAAGSLALYVAAPMDTTPFLAAVPSAEMTARDGEVLYAFLNDEGQWCFPRPLASFSPHLIDATLAVEDQRFWRHPGVDGVAVFRAAWSNLTRRRYVSGASTITMQLVKLARPVPRSLGGKLRQAALALRLDYQASKEQILAAYLNRAPYGMNLVGAEAAARRYFGKPARELSVPEAALLAGIPKAPTALQPLRHSSRARERRAHVLARMGSEGLLTPEALADAQSAGLGAAWHDFPRRAPHLAVARGGIRTTLDAPVQARAEAMVRAHVRRFGGEITNAAAIVVRPSSAEVLAYVGSADFDHTPGGGQVDVCRAVRSPGSTLKPFTYALAMERQCLYPPEQLLDDVVDYGRYRPGNFDGDFHGLVSATEGLRYSLNVPAITVLDRVGAPALQAFLKEGGFSTLQLPAEHYGLGLTLGSCGARLDELCAAYTALAALGSYRPLVVEQAAAPAQPRQWMSPGTALALYGMLEQPLPGETSANLARARGVRTRAAWKTGTSTGFHDAWAVVFNAQYVVGVWLGNNDGRASSRLVGAEAALPLAATIFRALPVDDAPSWPAPGGLLRAAGFCADTGLPAGEACPRRETVYIPRHQYLHRTCDVHRPDGTARWPGAAKGWNLARVAAPAEDDAPAAEETVALRILSPADGAEFVLTGLPEADAIAARASNGAGDLHWYLDGGYLGQTADGAPLPLALEAGQHTLHCYAAGRGVDTVRFSVTSAG